MEEMDENTTTSDKNVLEQFTTDITELAKKGLIDPVIGRNTEIQRVAQILSRRTKNNTVLVGEPGCGKTAIVFGLALMIIDGTCPSNLLDKKILSLDMSSIVAGTKYRGQFEERMKAIIKEISSRKDIIIFMDEIHNIVGAGSSSGSMDASNMLKPALSRGTLQVIGATTFDEYKKSIEKDGALERRFQKIIVEQPTSEETRIILENIKEKYEDFHNVRYTPKSLDLCVKLSERFITDRSFPDKAIDILDEAGSRTQISKSVPEEIINLNNKIKEVIHNKLESVKDAKFEKSVIFRDEERKLKEDLIIAKEHWNEQKSNDPIIIDEDEIRSVVSMISKIPIEKVSTNDAKKYLELENTLKKHIIGQDESLAILSKALRRSKTGITNPNKPFSFLMIGGSGVGKCCNIDTYVTIRNKHTNHVEKIKIKDFIKNLSDTK